MPIVYQGQRIDAGYRIDMWVEKTVIVENKTVEWIHFSRFIKRN